jgi:hypothetical protein
LRGDGLRERTYETPGSYLLISDKSLISLLSP